MKIDKTILFIILFGSFVLNGCGGATKRIEIAPQKQPSWYTNPPRSDATFLYSIGEGKDKQEALHNALNNLLEMLSVSLSSEYDAQTVVKEGSATTKSGVYKTHINAKVAQIRISNYEVLSSTKLGFKDYATLVRVDKKKLFRSLQNNVEQQLSFIEKQEKNIKKENGLGQLFFYKKALAELKDLKNTLLVMGVLDEHFDATPYFNRYVALEKKYQYLKKDITFSMHTTSATKSFGSIIAQGLTKEEFLLQNKKGKNHFDIFIETTAQNAKSYGFYIVRQEIKFITKDIHRKVIGSNTVHITGQSSQSSAIAQQDVAKRLQKQMEHEGVAKILNLDI